MNDLVSVIIPAYNAGERIRPCLESVIAQDYGNIEIIVVDDFSSDGTAGTAREILSRSSRNFTVTAHQHNKGVSSARNTGLSLAKGKYICFVDADDLVSENFVSTLHKTITLYDCDISFCCYVDRFCDGKPDENIIPVNCESNVIPGEFVILKNCVPPVWSCIYYADFLRRHAVNFLEGCSSGEDIDFVSRAMSMSERVSFADEFLYIYVHHAGMGSLRDSDTAKKKVLRYEHNTNAQRSTAEYIAEHSKSKALRDMAENVLMPSVVIREITLSGVKGDRAVYDALVKNESNVKILHKALNFLTLKKKPEIFVKALWIFLFPGIYFRVRKRLGL